MWYSPLRIACYSTGPPQVADCARKAVCGLCFIDCSSCQKFASTWDLRGLQLPSGHIQLLQHGVSTGCSVVFSSVWSLCEFLGNTFSCTTTGVVGKSLLNCLEHFLFLLSPSCLQGCFIFLIPLSVTAASQCFLPFPNYVITEATLEFLMSSDFGHWCVWFGTSWNWMCLTRSQLLVSSDENLRTPIPHRSLLI